MHRWDDNKPQTQQTQLPVVPNVTDVEKAYWNSKQDALVYDTEPIKDSHNILNSGSLYLVLTKLQEQIEVAYREYFEGADGGLGEATAQLQASQQVLTEALASLEEVNAYVRSVADEVNVRTEAALSYRNGSADSAATSKKYAEEAFDSAWRAMQAAESISGVILDMDKVDTIYAEVERIYKKIDDINTSVYLMYDDILRAADSTAQDSKDAQDAATLAESWAVGNTNKRVGENTDNSKYYSSLALNYKNDAETAAQLAAMYSDITMPEFYLDPVDMTLYVKQGKNITMQVVDGVLYYKLGA